jgi:hypothetical protein
VRSPKGFPQAWGQLFCPPILRKYLILNTLAGITQRSAQDFGQCPPDSYTR